MTATATSSLATRYRNVAAALTVRSATTVFFAAVLCLFSSQAFGQSLVAGDISGVVTDATSAAVPDSSVTLKSLDTGSTQTAQTDHEGAYRFSLLKPGSYNVAATKTGFQTSERNVQVVVGQNAAANLQLAVGQTSQTVEVTESVALLNTDSSTNTSFTPLEVAALPAAGGDITNIAFTAPGAVVNVTGGYGNFTVNGLPATSNLFTVNGENDMDPYFNINNSGATNLTLGANELQEATVITNAYGGQYGQLSSAQVSYVTMSGTNQFHGNAVYFWNGRAMNSNDWFNNFYGAPKPFSNANQYAGRVGGPIRKDKTFFFVDTEGLRFVLPNVISVTTPTAGFASAVLNNIATVQPGELAAYKTLFGLYQNAPGASGAQPIPNSSYCNTVVLPGYNGATTPCAAKYEATPTSLASEWILAFKIDHKISDKDNMYYRYRTDKGTQPTTLDPINANFDALSKQPAYDNQFSETHVFGPRSTNQFMATLSHYVAQFQQNAAAVASTFPYEIVNSGAVPFTTFNLQGSFPQGRNITQYQFIDDFTLIEGRHQLKFGVNYRRYDVSDHNFFYNNPAVYFGYTANGLQNFVNGIAYQYRQSLNFATDVPVALWGAGFYASDEWSLRSNLKLTLALRAEHNSNPVCQYNCFANFKVPFSSLASVTNANPGSVPYSSDIATGLHQAFQGTDAVNWSPRIGFSYSPGKSTKTVISGGFGIFYDNPAAGLVDDLLANPPVSVALRVRPAAGVLPFTTGPTGGAGIFQASANAFNINETYSQISTNLSNLGAVFAAPSFTAINGTVHTPRVYEWNVQIQRQLSGSTALTLSYVANHSDNILYSNSWPNAYDAYGVFTSVPSVPQSPKVPNYGTVTTVQNGALANYDGLSVIFRKQFSHSVTGHFTYTWSHALDDVSNGGLFTYGDSLLLTQLNPGNLKANNYGNADYDIRNSMTADFVYAPTFHTGHKFLDTVANGWQWSGKVFWRSGLPFSVTDNNWAVGNSSVPLLAIPISGGGPAQTSCGSGAAVTPCLNANAFLNSGAASFTGYPSFSTQTRNQFRGPHYFNSDMALYRNFRLYERLTLAVGVQAFNVFNHPNFANPDSGLGDATFGQITGMLNSPTSPYGSFLGFDSSVRVVQVTGKLTF